MNWTKIDAVVNGVFNRIGISVKRFPSREQRRLLDFLKRNKIRYILDVGANEGQFAISMFKQGYDGEIISFEPQSQAFAVLKEHASSYKNWKALHFAVGDFDGESEINISENSVSSSLLDILPAHTSVAPESKYISKEMIQVRRLDSVYADVVGNYFCFLKTDTQGFEMNVLRGSEKVFDKIVGIQLEMSCYPLYSNETPFDEMKKFIESKGFFLSSLENGFVDDVTGKLLQVDAVFLSGNIK